MGVLVVRDFLGSTPLPVTYVVEVNRMGEKGNIVIEDMDIFFYTHWKGYRTEEIVRKALIKGMDRWDDPPYLARIIFTTLIDGDESTTGYGISREIYDENYPPTIVNIEKQTVNGIAFKDFIK